MSILNYKNQNNDDRNSTIVIMSSFNKAFIPFWTYPCNEYKYIYIYKSKWEYYQYHVLNIIMIAYK